MEFNYFDIVVSVVVLLLGLKGIINGFFKEVFGLVGIIGGIFLASRVGDEVGEYLSELIFKFDSSAATNFTGFLVTLAIFWLFMVSVGHIFKRLSSLSGLSIYDRIFGFIFGAAKFFLIAAIISYAVYNVKAMRDTIDSTMKTSILFPVLVETGAYIMKIDPTELSKDINATIDDVTETIGDTVTKSVENSTLKIVKETKEKISSTMKDEK